MEIKSVNRCTVCEQILKEDCPNPESQREWVEAGNHICVTNPNCRICGRKLIDESDLWAGRCNNDVACQNRAKNNTNELKEGDEVKAGETVLTIYNNLDKTIHTHPYDWTVILGEGGKKAYKLENFEWPKPKQNKDG
jgi:hypothetical protein